MKIKMESATVHGVLDQEPTKFESVETRGGT